jgi:hypothetical protein
MMADRKTTLGKKSPGALAGRGEFTGVLHEGSCAGDRRRKTRGRPAADPFFVCQAAAGLAVAYPPRRASLLSVGLKPRPTHPRADPSGQPAAHYYGARPAHPS